MNQTQPYMDVHPSHFSSPQPYASHGATASAMGYSNYQPQPPVLHPGSAGYPSAGASYPQYGYPNGVTSPHSTSQPPSTSIANQSQLLPLPVSNHAVPPHGYVNGSTTTNQQSYPFDHTGQIAPPGAKPRVTATLWEDEGSLCYQVEAKGVCVARREDNHMINGTKLLNVAGMTRGRRDGILKSEKVRHVVKIGPMHLKGVWIPFERALDFANKEKITDLLYPLFVHNIGGLLYHPTNQNRTNMVVQDSQQRRLEGTRPTTRPSPGGQTSALHHHHSLQTPTTTHMSQSSAPSIPQSAARPTIDRSHTFPTPPTSASSVMNVAGQNSNYDWSTHNMSSGVQGTQPLSIDTGMNSARSMPTTPATTPPGGNVQGISSYQNQSGYDGSKQYYSSAPQSQPQYTQPQPMGQPGLGSYAQSMTSNSYIKTDMAPPAARPAGGPVEPDQSDTKSDRYAQANGQVGHGTGDGDPVQDHDTDYIHDSSAAYHANRNSYTYTTGDHSQLSSGLAAPQSHQNGGNDQMTPRTAASAAGQWAQAYSNTPPRSQTSVYNIVSDARNATANGADSFASASASNYSAPLGGSVGSAKRLREDDDDRSGRPDSRGADFDSKRRKTLNDAGVGGLGAPMMNLQQTVPAGVMRRR